MIILFKKSLDPNSIWAFHKRGNLRDMHTLHDWKILGQHDPLPLSFFVILQATLGPDKIDSIHYIHTYPDKSPPMLKAEVKISPRIEPRI